jgi:lon-related putative ATP-dependent protease
MSVTPRQLTPEELRFTCDPDQFDFETTDDLPDLHRIVGQERAVRAIDFGVDIPSHGFNIYVMGPAGTGKMTAIRTFLAGRAPQEPVADDWCYVNNFVDVKKPRAIQLPAGTGNCLQKDMAEFIRDLRRSIPAAFDSDDYRARSQAIVYGLDQARGARLEQLDQKALPYGLTVVQTSVGLGLAPVLEGQVLSPEAYARLPGEARDRFEANRQELSSDLDEAMRAIYLLEKQAKEQLRALNREVAGFVVGASVDDLEERYAAFPEVTEYLGEVRADIVENIGDFQPAPEQDQAATSGPRPPAAPGETDSPFSRYQVNLLVDHSQSQGAPVVYATNPTFYRLAGRVEQVVRYGMLTTDFTYIRGGYLHQANGGYLVVNARDLLAQPFAWDALKRAIRNRHIAMETVDELTPPTATTSLEPEPIPFRAKVILVGDTRTYYLLFDRDEDFRELFKVRADFGHTMGRSAESVRHYAELIASQVRADRLLPFDRGAVARVVEYGVRLAEDKAKLTASFGEVVELIHEAAHWARTQDHQVVTDADVDRALEERRFRSSHLEERVREDILHGSINVQTEGNVIGQVNGLTVLQTAGYEFGVPTRISAQTYMGRGGVVAIDREAHLTGNIYNKAILILQGYLGGKYARRRALNVAASVTLEQNYDRIEGDSASSAELYALLSSLSGLPVRQDIAVTGSVDQQGHVQAIGSVVAKIEGFFDLCRARGLTGSQGVLIPADNVRHLVLRRDVVEAVARGEFHIYAVENIDEGIELLTGLPAGKANGNGKYPEGSVNYLVQKKLMEMADERAGGPDEEEEEEIAAAPPVPEEAPADEEEEEVFPEASEEQAAPEDTPGA